jgi:NADPH:quinone reductase-like Zn-dependent oxidoreductase
MKAIILTEQGGPENLVLRDIDKPTPGPGDVLVKVHAISINPVDVKTRKGGALYGSLQQQPPVILGWDISGVVVETGNEAGKFEKGEAVFGMVNFPGHGKAYAEYVAVPQDQLALKPHDLSHEDAAASTLAALTAWQVLVHEGRLQRGQHLLMHAAAGGVGHFAVQIAKYLGAKVTGTSSEANKEFLFQLGIDQHIDYNHQDLKDVVRDMDFVFDPIGGDTTARSLEVLKKSGTLFSIVGGVKEHLQETIRAKDLQARNYLVQSSGSDMAELALLLREGIIRPVISHRFNFDEMTAAHRQMETGKTRGKIVVIVRRET